MTDVDTLLEDLNDLVSDWTGCTDCQLCHGRTNQVWFRIEGEPDPEGIMILGEAPGADEDKQGVPFVGRAGAKLNRLAIEAGIDRAFITNTVLCRPPNNRNPKRPELRACWPRLQRTIEIMRPSVIVCAGNIPAQWLLETDKSMRSMSSKVFVWEMGDFFVCRVIPIYHPAYLLRQRSASMDKQTIDRLELAKRIAGR